MSFYDVSMEIISREIKNRDNLQKVIKKIETASKNGKKIAFYPSGVYSRVMLKEIRQYAPELLSKVLGCFDRSSEATMEGDVNVYELAELNKLKDKIGLLVVTSNTFHAKEMRHIQELTSYKGRVLNTSRFDITFPEKNDKEIIADIKKVYDLLADQKSKMAYLITWLSRLLNDEDLTYIFESEDTRDVDVSNPILKYKNYMIEGLDDVCKQELNAELYEMKYVKSLPGDVVFDVGAYKGDTAVYFADRVGKKGKVYSFEPVKANYNTLVKNIKRNKLEDIIVPINKGCAPKTGSLKIVSSNSGAPWSFVSENKGIENVEMIALDDFIRSNKIDKLDFIKMDVEGFEESALLGAQETIKQFRPKLAICLYHLSSDILRIPFMIHKLADYKLYVRCQMEGPYGINLYGIKK